MSILGRDGYRAESVKRKLGDDAAAHSKRRAKTFFILFMIAVMSCVTYLIAFAGMPKILPPLITSAGGKAPAQVVSALDFSYESKLLTDTRRMQVSESAMPSYRINDSIFSTAEENIDKLESVLNDLQASYKALEKNGKVSASILEDYSAEIKKNTSLNISPEDIQCLLAKTTPSQREEIFNQSKFRFKTVLADGVYPNNDTMFADYDTGSFKLEGVSPARIKIRSETAAMEDLKRKIFSIGSVSDEISYVFFRIFNQEIRPNIEFDEVKTAEKKQLLRDRVRPVVIKVREGEVIVDPDMPVTDLTKEKYKAYREEMHKKYSSDNKKLSIAINDFLCSLLLISGGTLFIIVSKTRSNKRGKTIAVFLALFIFNLLAERAVIHIGSAEMFKSGNTLLHIFIYGTPVMLGPILMVIFYSSYMGFIMALILSSLTTLMLAQGMEFFIVLFISSLVAIYFFDGAKTRSRVILGGFIYGLVLAVCSIIFGSLAGIDAPIISLQSLMALGSGILMGILATALLPLVEKIFGISSNITLLELTDFNNPLLSKLQMEAPGTYHHSVMVAQLAEYAASRVRGANPLKCRVGALYHDIGKLIKPECFSENQSASRNPHDDMTPSMSALVIKSHIKEGVELAKLNKMPKPVMDAIEEHHGTSIIAYFYNKAQNIAASLSDPQADPMQALRDAGIDENTYRHEGRKPRSVETAILLLADSCEAASRSLKHLTQHSVEELVDKIVRQKMNDGQLDDAPVTLEQLDTIKRSFVFTMLTMLHSRVSYNNEPKRNFGKR